MKTILKNPILKTTKCLHKAKIKLIKIPKINKLFKSKVEFKKRENDDPLHSLAKIIIYQQLSTKAAQAIEKKFLKLFANKITALKLKKIHVNKLREAGLSLSKANYIKNVAQAILEKKIPDRDVLLQMPDKDIIEVLTQVKGVGVWTAQMYLLFYLGRGDVWPTTDYGIRKAVQKFFRYKELPSPNELEVLSSTWSPHRSVVALYLWKSLEEK